MTTKRENEAMAKACHHNSNNMFDMSGTLCLWRTYSIADVLFCDHNNHKYVLFGNLRRVGKVNGISNLILEWRI